MYIYIYIYIYIYLIKKESHGQFAYCSKSPHDQESRVENSGDLPLSGELHPLKQNNMFWATPPNCLILDLRSSGTRMFLS